MNRLKFYKKKNKISIFILTIILLTTFSPFQQNFSKALVKNIEKPKVCFNEKNLVPIDSNHLIPEKFEDNYWNYIKTNTAFTDTGTYFFGNHDCELEWIKETYTGSASAKTNYLTGSVNTRGNAWVGEGRAESRCTQFFYIGREKDLNIEGKTISLGGTAIVYPAAVASTSTTMMVDNDQNKWWHEDIDSPFDEEWFIGELLWFCELLGYVGGATDIATLFSFLENINSYYDLYQAFQNVSSGDKDETIISKSLTLGEGTHSASVGLRSDAVGGGIGYAFAARAGMLEYIYINGIAPPNDPVVYGSWGTQVNQPCEVHFRSNDPNEDNVKYFIDWGDETNSGWTDYYAHNTEQTMSHVYDEVGYYTIKIKAKDIDLMESDWGFREIRIESEEPCPVVTITSGPSGVITYNDVNFNWIGSDDLDPPEDLLYQYKLEGYNDWSNWNSDMHKSYNNLEKGAYTFKIKAKDTADYIGGVTSRIFTIQDSGTITIGETREGYSGLRCENNIIGSRFCMGNNYGEGNSITVFLSCSETAKHAKCAIYEGEEPYFDLVDNSVTEEKLISPSGQKWHTFYFQGTKPILKANKEYILVISAEDKNGCIWINGHSGSGYYNDWYTIENYNEFPNPSYLYHSDSDWQFSIYCNYIEKNFPPTVNTKQTYDFEYNSATLKGELLDLGGFCSTQVWFELGETSSYGFSTSTQTKNSPCDFSQKIYNLNPDTTYHYRACASNNLGIDHGSDKTFTTRNPNLYPPIVITKDATNVDYTWATLNLELTDIGGTESCKIWFEWGETTDYPNSCDRVTVNSPQSSHLGISLLSPGKTYHFRACASNSEGTTNGEDKTFTTKTNDPPIVPQNPSPSNNSIILTRNPEISWISGDQNYYLGDEISFDIYFGLENDLTYKDTIGPFDTPWDEFSYKIYDLQPSTNYYWKIIANDKWGDSTIGPIWQFTTQENKEPLKPEKPMSEAEGKINSLIKFKTSTTDPDDDKIYYKFDWGDGRYSSWLGPCESGEEKQKQEKFSDPGTYEIRVKAKDDPNNDGDLSDGKESEWSEPHTININKKNKHKTISIHFWINLLKNYKEKFPLLIRFLLRKNIFY